MTDDLSLVTTEDLWHELAKRQTHAVFLFTRPAETGEMNEVSGCWYKGGVYAAWGMVVAQRERMLRTHIINDLNVVDDP